MKGTITSKLGKTNASSSHNVHKQFMFTLYTRAFVVHELLFLSQLTATSVYTENSSVN